MTGREPGDGPEEPSEPRRDPVNHHPPEEWRPGDPGDPIESGEQPPGEPAHEFPPQEPPRHDPHKRQPPPGGAVTPGGQEPGGHSFQHREPDGGRPPEGPAGAHAYREQGPSAGPPDPGAARGGPAGDRVGEPSEGPNGAGQAGYEHAGYPPGQGEADASGAGAGGYPDEGPPREGTPGEGTRLGAPEGYPSGQRPGFAPGHDPDHDPGYGIGPGLSEPPEPGHPVPGPPGPGHQGPGHTQGSGPGESWAPGHAPPGQTGPGDPRAPGHDQGYAYGQMGYGQDPGLGQSPGHGRGPFYGQGSYWQGGPPQVGYAYPPPGGPEPSGTPWGKIIGIGCGVLLLLLLVGGGCTAVALIAAGTGDTETGGAQSRERGDDGLDETRGAEVTATDTDFEPSPLYSEGVYTSVAVSVTNAGEERLDVNPLYFSIVDAEGSVHSTSEAIGMDANELGAQTLAPGQTTSGAVTVEGRVDPERVVFEPFYSGPVEVPVS